ncbi:hypothetical protein PCG10_006910 [Penicillium crustosum]|uniref:Uncharacterized protein n=1 Tax=Penicillium crustosum TaxID=36656 RepID=A0A9P5GGY9_PENCR|nr:uncharacterized protein N7487_007260 [Penicillium crustosum]KAF7522956.1 hypothetical protein PCG10_006910 [Penicillium crustosum]KAJ5401364.1 hypothetical protein N7487_007260 [Penicillium crustosum]
MNPAAQYYITHNSKSENYDVSTTDKTHLYHIDNSTFTIGKPDLTFHHSPDSKGPVVGVCKFRHFSSDCEIGLADPERFNKMKWEYLHKEGFIFKRAYWFRMELDDGTKQSFTWKQTSSLGSGSGNHKLVKENGQTVVAVLSSGGIFSKKIDYGYLDIYSNLGPRFYLMALISGIAVVERIRRAKPNAAGGAAGGSSAGGGGIC